jgi:hypothetical protein
MCEGMPIVGCGFAMRAAFCRLAGRGRSEPEHRRFVACADRVVDEARERRPVLAVLRERLEQACVQGARRGFRECAFDHASSKFVSKSERRPVGFDERRIEALFERGNVARREPFE